MNDTFRHKGLRNQMVRELIEQGITDPEVQRAISVIPRHLFLDQAFVLQAYTNIAFRIGAGQTISQPYTVAFQTSLLGPIRGKKVLEIGTGSGYQASVLCELGAKVYTIERQRELFDGSTKMLAELGYVLRQKYGDGYEGWPAFAPFDCILVTCGANDVPASLVEQLSLGGSLVIPVGSGEDQDMFRLTKKPDGSVSSENFGSFRFVPMLKQKAR